MRILTVLFTISLLVSCGKNDFAPKLGRDLLGVDDQITDVNNKINDNRQRIERIENELSSLYNMINNVNINQSILEDTIALHHVKLTTLKTEERIVQTIDPCGSSSGYDEVIFKTNTGKYVAYFEKGNNRFMTILKDGNYRTTDDQKCNFTISNGDYSE